ncbi:hypothetical protein [Saccharospirillum sp. MSK14-1]|uniref:hypothetical protein n=1 Tax=Saccharospirillum sp. MSK14-1 TaxID=1897632 RepID=UPI0011B285D7|nr:hypothetical protein [Saccharospirillum sp. MSK14-1]
MNSRAFTIATVMSAVLFSSCGNSGGSNSEPVIDWVVGDIRAADASFFTRQSLPSDHSLDRFFSIKVSDADGLSDITEIFYSYPNSSEEYQIFDYADDEFNENGYFGVRRYSTSLPDTVELKGWSVRVVDSAGHSVSKSFDFPLPNLADSTAVSFVYSPAYTGGTNGGVEALALPTDMATSSIDYGNETITIEYAIDDDRVKNVRASFYTLTGERVGYLTNQFIPVTDGTVDSLPFLKSEISFVDTYTFTDIKTFHLFLRDDMTLTEAENGYSNWWRYLTIGELVELN